MISDTKLQEKIKFIPHPAQDAILKEYNTKRDLVISAGVRFGKTYVCAYLCLKEILVPNRRIWIVAPTYELTEKTFNYIDSWRQYFPRLFVVQKRPILKISIPSIRSWIECKSGENPQGMLGEELDLAIIDEASQMRKEIWENFLFSRLTSRKGKSVVISTPFGKNWFYERWISARQRDDAQAFHFKSKDNPYFPIEEWERAKSMLPDQVFKQDYEASFLDDAAAVLRGVRECIKEIELNQSPVYGHTYCMGVDLGKVEDFTVITVIDEMTHEVVSWDRFNKLDWTFQKARIVEYARKYDAHVLMDATTIGSPMLDDLLSMNLNIEGYQYTNQSKNNLIRKLMVTIEQKRVFYPHIDTLIDEMESFSYKLTDSGNITYQAPPGLHDDAVNSLALACWSLGELPLQEGIYNEPYVPLHIDYK